MSKTKEAIKLLYEHCRNPALEEIIKNKLIKRFRPTNVEVIDESHLHQKHKGAQTHYTIYLKSNTFEDKSMSQRHQEVVRELEEELMKGVYAFYIIAKTPDQ